MSDRPYVGEGVDGWRRSAQIAREEAGTYSTGSMRWLELMARADDLERRADLERNNDPKENPK